MNAEQRQSAEEAVAMLAKEPATQFWADVLGELIEPARQIRSLNEAFARLGGLLIHLQELSQSSDLSRTEKARSQLVAIAATAWQAARDLGIESRSDAIGKDIPF